MKKAKILFICNKKYSQSYFKATQLKNHLVDTFDVGICCLSEDVLSNFENFDVYFVLSYSAVSNKSLSEVPSKNKIATIFLSGQYFPNLFKDYSTVCTPNFKLYNELSKKHNNLYYLPDGINIKNFNKHFKTSPVDKKKISVGTTLNNNSAKFVEDVAKMVNCECVVFDTNDTLLRKDRANFYEKVDVLISTFNTNGMPISVLESAASGRPVIVDSDGNTNNFIRDNYNGFVITGKNKDSYIEKLRYFKNNRSEILRMGSNALKSVNDGWDWSNRIKEYEKIINALISPEKKKTPNKTNRLRRTKVKTIKDVKPEVNKPRVKKKKPKKIKHKPLPTKKPNPNIRKKLVREEKHDAVKKREPVVKSFSSKPKPSSEKFSDLHKVKTESNVKENLSNLKKDIRRLIKIEKSLINKRNELRLRTKLLKEDVKNINKE